MAGSSRPDLAAGSPEGSTFSSAYPNGQRGNYSSASLDRSGSFREGVENRLLNSGPGLSRGSTPMSMEMSPSQFLYLEQLVTADQKFTRSGELRRVLGVSVASTSEEHSFGGSQLKPCPPIATEELKRFKASVLDTTNKTRDRSKRLGESIGKLDKYRSVIISKKRRTESSERSGGTGIPKMGSQIHQNPSDVTQRLEDRNKNVVLNKRVRTSLVEAEGRNAPILRQPVVMDKDRDMVRACNGSSLPVEEKVRGLPTSGEGWDKKMKRKRSVGTVATRAIDGEREMKRPMHQKLPNDTRSRTYDANGFGSGPTNGLTGMNKLDTTSQANTSNGRVITRNEMENVNFPNDRRERGLGIDKERVLPKGNKANPREEIQQVGSPSPVTKAKASRGPRTGSAVTNSSPSFSRTPGAIDGWEQPSCLNKVQPMGGINNRKRPIPTGSSSPPMAQWVGQRQQKSSRTRRANLVSPVSVHDEPQLSSEGFSAPDFSSRLAVNEASGSLFPRGVSTSSQHLKMKFENVPSPARLSESEESGAGENKIKEKGMDNDETVDRSVNTMPKVGSVMMPTKKNRMNVRDDIGDGVRRQGRSGRGSSVGRAGNPHIREKLENTVTTKPLQSTKPGSDKNESKSGRPPSKKSADRKAFSRSGLNSGSSDMTGESDDDREELLAAASAVHSAQHLACSGPFWKKMEPIFALVSPEETAYLKRQLNFAEELDESLHHMFGADFSVLGELVQNEAVSSLSNVSKDSHEIYLNGTGYKGPDGTLGSVDLFQDSSLSGKLNGARSSGEVPPLYQRVLSALIGDDEVEEIEHSSDRRHASFQYANDHADVEDLRVYSDVDSEMDFRTPKHCAFDSFSCDGSTASNSFRSSSVNNPVYNDEQWPGDDKMVNSEVGFASGFVKNHSQSLDTNNGSFHSLEFPYEQMSLDDRLLLELQSIGLYPEAVPDLAEGEEEEEINKDIVALQEDLYQQVGKKKGQLCKIDKVIQKGRELEERNLEQIAMNNLVESAYKKRMACRGNNATKSGVSRITKQAALAFVKRTISRCRKFEETGKSCFSEPALRDTIFSSGSSDVKPIDGAAANTCVEAHNSQPESRTSAVGSISTPVERHAPFGDKLDRSSSDAFQAEQEFAKQESISNRGKKKEVLLDEVAGSRASSALGSTITGGAKGRRSERDRDQNKFVSTRNSVAKAGRPAMAAAAGGFRGERKNKTKPKQKTAQLSTSGNGLLGRAMDTSTPPNPVYPPPLDSSNERNNKASREVGLPPRGDPSKETDKPVDLSGLPIPEMDSIEGIGEIGVSDWLDFEEDGLLDHDSMGLEIPMDDLSELHMLI